LISSGAFWIAVVEVALSIGGAIGVGVLCEAGSITNISLKCSIRK